MYRFKIKDAANGQYRVQFVYGSQVMVWSENYATKASAQNCINSVKINALNAPIVDTTIGESATGSRIEILLSTNKQYFIRFKAPNGETLVWSEEYTAKHNAKSCAEAVKYNAGNAPVDDETSSKVA
ncbi:YegP family protein [Mesorhizobium sp. 128a]